MLVSRFTTQSVNNRDIDTAMVSTDVTPNFLMMRQSATGTDGKHLKSPSAYRRYSIRQRPNLRT